MSLAEIIVGLVLMTFGRKLFWVFVGGAGFAAGVWLIQTFLPAQPQGTVLVGGAIGAVSGILLTRFIKSVAINVGGFLGGGIIGLGLARMIGEWIPEWLAVLAMGILGVVFLRAAFETALLLISSIAGAVLVARNLPVSGALQAALVVALSVAGVLLQKRPGKGISKDKEAR